MRKSQQSWKIASIVMMCVVSGEESMAMARLESIARNAKMGMIEAKVEIKWVSPWTTTTMPRLAYVEVMNGV